MSFTEAPIVWYHGHTTSSTARLLFRATSTGTLAVSVDGITYTTSVDTGVQDGTAVVDISGLKAGTKYQFTAVLGGNSVSGTIRTVPLSNFKVAWVSCQNKGTRFISEGIEAIDPDVFYAIGDTPYTIGSSTKWGFTALGSEVDDSISEMYVNHKKLFYQLGWDTVRHGRASYMQVDDHEWCGDNWDHTPTQYDSQNGGPLTPGPTQAQVDASWNNGNLARIAYHQGNPDNDDAEAVAEKPSNADAGTPASYYPPKYFRHTVGSVEFFCIDCISYRSPVAATDDASKTMLGANQKAWLKAKLLASSATFKVIMSPKKTRRISADNGDTYGQYQTEMNEIGEYIDTNGITGVLWCSGDRHTPQVILSLKSAGKTYDLVDVCACPVGVLHNSTTLQEADDTAGVYWIKSDTHAPSGEGRGKRKVYGLLDVHGSEYIDVSIMNVHDNSVLWTGRLLAGTNTITYATQSISYAS